MDDPRQLVEQWTKVWNEGRLDLVAELVTDPCLRHHPGGTESLTLADNIERVRAGRERFAGVSFESHVLVAASEHVTACYTMRWDDPTASGGRRESAGIEVFRIVGGRIIETWNVEPQPGPWC